MTNAEELEALKEKYTMPIGKVAELFLMPKNTVRRRIANGTIPLEGMRFGANTSPILYAVEDVNAALESYVDGLLVAEQAKAPKVEDEDVVEAVSHAPALCVAVVRPATEIDPLEMCMNDALPGLLICEDHTGWDTDL